MDLPFKIHARDEIRADHERMMEFWRTRMGQASCPYEEAYCEYFIRALTELEGRL